jgi:phosphatidate cytidylyltransferase
MNEAARQRWFSVAPAWEDTFFLAATCGIAGLIVLAVIVTFVLHKAGVIGDERSGELHSRLRTWVLLAAAIGIPIFLGAFWTIIGLFVLSVFCYREFARITGLFRRYIVSAAVVIGLLFVFFAVLDHWYAFFVALPILGVGLIAGLGVLSDRPSGYLQRVALGVLAFVMFGVSLGHVAYIANDPGYRSLLLLFLIAVELNDVFAYLAGNLFGRKKLAPNTSPNKTVGGAVGAVVGTTALVFVLGRFAFDDPAILAPVVLLGLGVLISVTGQLGDLVISSVKRDLGIKDTGNILPGHGGMLDRFDSLILAGPAFFHYVGHFIGFGRDEPIRILSGG